MNSGYTRQDEGDRLDQDSRIALEFRTSVVIGALPGLRSENGDLLLPSKAPFSKASRKPSSSLREAAGRRVAGLSPSTVRAIDVRYLKRWAAHRGKPALRLGKKHRFLTLVSKSGNGETLVVLSKKETLDEFLRQQQRLPVQVIRVACIDMSEPLR
jgi:hypothetical protein